MGFENPFVFEKLYIEPSFLRETQVKQATQTETLTQNQNYMNIEDDSSEFFLKNIPD